jgi:ankyrin repeat protein
VCLTCDGPSALFTLTVKCGDGAGCGLHAPDSTRSRTAGTVGLKSIRQRLLLSGRRTHDLSQVTSPERDGLEPERAARLRQLLADGADPNHHIKVPWRQFKTLPLFEASVIGEEEVVKVLLDAGTDANKSVGPGLTPLYHAALNGHDAVVSLLCAHGATAASSTPEGFTALYVAAQNHRIACVSAMLASPAVNAAVVNFAPSELSGATPLYVATQEGHADVVAKLAAYQGVDLNVRMHGDGSTPLMAALYLAKHGSERHMHVLEQLLRAGASLKVTDASGRSALQRAPPEWREALQDFSSRGGADGGLAQTLQQLLVRKKSESIGETQRQRQHHHEMDDQGCLVS